MLLIEMSLRHTYGKIPLLMSKKRRRRYAASYAKLMHMTPPWNYQLGGRSIIMGNAYRLLKDYSRMGTPESELACTYLHNIALNQPVARDAHAIHECTR